MKKLPGMLDVSNDSENVRIIIKHYNTFDEVWQKNEFRKISHIFELSKRIIDIRHIIFREWREEEYVGMN